MLIAEIESGSTTYTLRIPDKASEYTLDKLIQYEQKIEANKPEVLKKLEEIEEEEDRKDYLDSIGIEELESKTLSYYLREIHFFTEMSTNLLSSIPVKSKDNYDVFSLRDLIRKPIIITKPEEISSFMYLGKEYFLPPAPPNLFDSSQKDYMRGSKIGEYATASELLRSLKKMNRGSIEGLLNVIAVICRRKNEEFPVYPDEQTKFIQDRIKLFRGLDYQTALNVGFFLTKRETTYLSASQSLLAVRMLRRALYRKNTDTI